MQIYLGADHGGFQLKEEFKRYLVDKYPEIQAEDCGAHEFDAGDDYPLFALEVAKKVASDEQSLGVLLCRSGSGVVIAANKVKGVRAVELYDAKITKQAKSHNHANVIAFGGDYLSLAEMTKLFEIFLETEQDPDERHKRRLQQINNYENNN
jgi:ribose 5-phosphate isomerase B